MGKTRKPNNNVNRILASVQKKHALIEDDIKGLLEQKKEISLPISIFNERLGMLESASLYLKDELNLGFKEIANHLKRDYKTIWTSYNKAKKKLKNAR